MTITDDLDSEQNFGQGDGTYRAVGGFDGLKQLIDDFYDIMSTGQDYAEIWSLHTKAKDIAKDKLISFLSGWMGGPRLYKERYGAINIPSAHRHLPIDERARDLWLACMLEAIQRQHYSAKLQTYLMEQLFVPADRIRAQTS